MPRSTSSARSHAARTCIQCKRGKRRCELPRSSQRLEGGVTLLDEDSCQRCRRLQVPCILDATYRYSHLHQLAAAPTPTPPVTEDHEPDSPAKVEVLHTHPKNVEEYEAFFPRYLPFALMRDFYDRTVSKLPQHPCLMPIPEVTLDELISDEQAAIAAEWAAKHIIYWLPFTPSLLELRAQRKLSSGPTPRSLLFLETAQCDLAIQHGAFPMSPANSDKVATWTAWYCRDLIANPAGEHLTEALLLAAVFLPLIPDRGVFRQIAILALQSCQEDTLQSRICHVESSTLHGAAILDDDDEFYAQNSALKLPSIDELDKLEVDVTASFLPPSQKAGCYGSLLRCRAWVAMQQCVADCYIAFRSAEPEAARLTVIDHARMRFSNESRALCVRRGALLSSSPLATWLDFENHALDLIISGIVLHFALGDQFSPQFYHDVSSHKAGSEVQQSFLDVHGPLNSESTECVLAAVSNLPTKDVLYPTTLTFAYSLRGVIMALEIYAASFKLWRLPPPREPVWALLLRSVDDTLRRLKGGGGQVAARITITSLSAARETIRRWRAELVTRSYNPSVLHRPTTTPETPASSTSATTPLLKPGLSQPNGTFTVTNGFEPVPGFAQHAFDPMVTSFAEWIADIDWSQFAVADLTPE